jgi:hypothetical protein
MLGGLVEVGVQQQWPLPRFFPHTGRSGCFVLKREPGAFA